MRRSTVFGSAAAACAAVVLGSCSGVPELTPITTYGSANAFTPSGYSQTKIDDTHYTVKAPGTEASPKPRIAQTSRAPVPQLAGHDNPE